MGFSIRILADHRLAVVRLEGCVSVDDLIGALDRLYGTPSFRPGFDAVWDARAIDQLDLLPAHVDRVQWALWWIRPRFGVGRTAVIGRAWYDVVTTRLITIRYKRRWERRLTVVTSAHDAAAWLGVPSTLLEGD